MAVQSSASSNVSGGRIVASRRASIVLPAPGGPHISRLWPPAARDLERAARRELAAHVGEVGVVIGQRTGRVPVSSRASSGLVQRRTGFPQRAHRAHLQAGDDARLAGVLRRQAGCARAQAPGRGRNRQHAADGVDAPSSDSSPSTSVSSIDGARRLRSWRVRRARSARSKHEPAFRTSAWRQVDGDAPHREFVARVLDGGPHAVAALAHGDIRQAPPCRTAGGRYDTSTSTETG
jgi:hypothetical protein